MRAASLPRFERVRADGELLETSDWTLRPEGLELVLAAIEDERETIVELGTGLSTLAIGRSLRRRGRHRLYSLEHDRELADRIRERITAEGLGDVISVIDAPLAVHPAALDGAPWYAPEALDALPRQGIELLLVDGPPAGDRERALSRYPALPALRDRLASGSLVVLDDFDRPGERETLARWQREFGLEFEFDPAARIASATIP